MMAYFSITVFFMTTPPVISDPSVEVYLSTRRPTHSAILTSRYSRFSVLR